MRVCFKCKEEKSEDLFRWKDKRKGTMQPYCIPCSNEYSKQNYERNKTVRVVGARVRSKEHRNWWQEYKSGLKCIQCGENHPATLDFHHRDPSQKDFSLSKMIGRRGRKSMLDEISKCDVLCSNCHRKVHYDLNNPTLA